MKFYNIDLHISIIADMKKIFTELGHEVKDVSLSNHTWVFNKPKGSIPMLDNGRWMNLTPEQYSNEFYRNYKDELSDYDAFIVTYPPPFSLLYKHFKKPIIINNPIRYEWPFSFNSKNWNDFNDYLRKGVDDGLILLVANNLYDKYYMEDFIERDVEHIPSICNYYNEEYIGDIETFIYYSRNKIKELKNPKIKWKNELFSTHKHSDLLKYKGIIHIPYQISYMSIFEQYASNVPLFFPTKRFLLELYDNNYNVLNEVSWNNLQHRESKSCIDYKGEFDPNNYLDIKSVESWLKYSDFYDSEWMPYITYFDSFEELDSIVENINVIDINEKMISFNNIRKKLIYNKWDNLIKNKIVK
jgi:hypothetical protein